MMAATSILHGLDAEPLSPELLAEAVAVLAVLGRGGGSKDHVGAGSVEVVPGTENTGSVPSALLRVTTASGSQHAVFLKKITAVAMAKKAWADRRRTLAYARTECRFYREFASELLARGVRLPAAVAIDERLEASPPPPPPVHAPPPPVRMCVREGGAHAHAPSALTLLAV